MWEIGAFSLGCSATTTSSTNGHPINKNKTLLKIAPPTTKHITEEASI